MKTTTSTDARETVAYHCPSCNAVVESQAWRARVGIKCEACGTGFIPLRIEERETAHSEPAWFKWMVCGVLLLLALPLFFVFWPVAVVLLLGAVAWLMYQQKGKQ